MSKLRSLMAMAMVSAMAASAGESMYISKGDLYREPSYKRKKCKSCKYLNKYGSRCDCGKRTAPHHQACDKYKAKKK